MNRSIKAIWLAFAVLCLSVTASAQVQLGGHVFVPSTTDSSLGQSSVAFTSDANCTVASATNCTVSNGLGGPYTGTLVVTGTISATRNVVVPLSPGRSYTVENKTTGGQSIVIIGATGNGVLVPNGQMATVNSDGTSYFTALGGALSGTLYGQDVCWHYEPGNTPLTACLRYAGHGSYYGAYVTNDGTTFAPAAFSVGQLNVGQPGATGVNGQAQAPSLFFYEGDTVATGPVAPLMATISMYQAQPTGACPNAGVSGAEPVWGFAPDATISFCTNAGGSTWALFSSGATPAATQKVQGSVFLPVTASSNVLPRINVSVCTFITNIGNSIDAGTGATTVANSWVSIFDTLICPNALDTNGQTANRAVAGTFMSDNIDFGILFSTTSIKSFFALNVPASNSGLSTIGGPDNEDNNTDALNANQQVNYQQELAAGIILRGIPTIELYMVGSNTGTTYSTTTTAMDYYSAIPPAQTMSTAGETATHSFVSYGGPIYALYNIYPSDTGTMTVSIDGNLVTDTITGSSTLANAPYSGADFLTSSGFTQTLAAARFTGIAAGTHTIVYTCVAPGTNGCAPQITATPPWDPTQYSIPTVAVRGAIRQLGDAKSAATAAYDALVTAVVNPLYADGLNVVKIPVRNFLNLNNYANAMAGTDGHSSAAIVNTAITVTSGSATITGTGSFDGSYFGKLAYCLDTATASTTLYTTVKSWSQASPTTLLLNANAGVSGTVTCWFGALGDVWPASASPGQHPNNWGHLLLAQAALSVLQPVTIQPPVLGTTFTNFTKSMATNVGQSGGIFNMNYAGATPGTLLTSPPYCGLLFGSNSNTTTSINLSATCFSRDTVKGQFFTGVVSQFNTQTKIGDNNVSSSYTNGSFRWDFVFDNSAGGVNGNTDQGIFFNNGLDSYTTTTLASAATLQAPASKFINVTGTAAISAITVPPGSASLGSAAGSPALSTYEGCINFTASGGTAGTNAWTVTAGATILTSFQAIFGQQYTGCYDGTNWRFSGPGIGSLSGMTATQVAIAATATTVTSSKALAGSGAAITTGPTTSTSGDLASFTGTAGQIADSGGSWAAPLAFGATTPNTVKGTTITGTNLTDGTASLSAGSLTAAVNGTFSGTVSTANLTVSSSLATTGSVNAAQVTLTPLGSATSGANFNSGFISESASYWNGTAATGDAWQVQNTMGTGTNPTGTLLISHTGGTSGVVNVELNAPVNATSYAGIATAASSFVVGVAAGGGSGTAACATSHVCDNFSGEVTLTPAGTLTTGLLLTITLPTARAHIPNCTVTVQGGSPLALITTNSWVESDTSHIAITANTAPIASAYQVNYICGGN